MFRDKRFQRGKTTVKFQEIDANYFEISISYLGLNIWRNKRSPHLILKKYKNIYCNIKNWTSKYNEYVSSNLFCWWLLFGSHTLKIHYSIHFIFANTKYILVLFPLLYMYMPKDFLVSYFRPRDTIKRK